MSNVNIKIMGDGFISEGEYGNIKIMGNASSEGNVKADVVSNMGDAQFNGDIDFASLKIMGSIKGQGNLVSQRTKVMGSLDVSGDAAIEELVVDGETVLNGDLRCNNVTVNGRLTVRGNIYAKSVKVRGEMRAEKNISSEAVDVDGQIQCEGLLNAEKITITPRAKCHCKEMGASKISVQKPKYNFIASLFISGRYGKLESEIIEADDIELQYVVAKEVKGHNINLIDDCKINHVEYSGTFNMSETCKVETQTQRG